MGNYLIDFLTKDEIFIAKKRNKRPYSYTAIKNIDYEEVSKQYCPFCEHNSHMIPDIISQKNDIRVIPNKYPIIDDDYGKHEVLIESTNHSLKFYDDDNTNCIEVFKMIQDRYKDLIKSFKHVSIFKNEGHLSGASLYHSHWQILAHNNATPRNKKIHTSFCEYLKNHNKNYFYKNNKDLLVFKETDYIIAFVPEVTRTSLQTRIFTKRKVSSFEEINEKELKDLALTVKDVLQVYKKEYEDFSYNILFHDFDTREEGHFYIEIMPRLGKFGGYELSSESYITSSTGIDSLNIFNKYFL